MLIQNQKSVLQFTRNETAKGRRFTRPYMRICARLHILYIDSARTRARETLFVIKITNKNFENKQKKQAPAAACACKILIKTSFLKCAVYNSPTQTNII